ncbi:xanthine dehydrogenase family protein molybdopterin-binding subunit [Acidobacterium sp. S8]|uniref:xanthine dehydrogenase family protein molybdopterin-binding subunit n=1 Tax=Acidobacterium sp. S8 TaxID=1641854 RepID=UPI00131BD554|nr:xanthine dehydrogenase family protein molybdopterin-binding subunit [Acidobacterium sp. S8]
MQTPETQPSSVIGTAVPRVDGRLKTTGAAMYSSDYSFPGMVYLVPVCSPIAKGRITKLDASAAEKMPGVLRVMYHGHAPVMYRPIPGSDDAFVDETRPPFEDEVIYYSGQFVAAVVAETVEQARAAAETVQVEYASESPNVATDLSDGWGSLADTSHRGDAGKAFAAAPVQIDETYVTPVETHNPIELHASVAVWDGKKFTLYETTQSLLNHQAVMAQFLGVPNENVQIVMKFLGSGFGGKLWPWTHAPLAAATARELNRPVKAVVTRKMMFSNVGHRPRTQQRIRLGATHDGKLVSLQHDYVNHTSMISDYDEGCGEATPYIYSTPNLLLRAAKAQRNIGPPTAMRGPGAVPGLYALESAMDELAIKLKMDPVELRLRNEPEKDESNGKPFSSRHLKECLTTGVEKFGWAKRNPAVGSMRKGDLVLGWGMACASWGAFRMAAQVSVALNNDGTARVSCATQDIGTGTYTIFAQVVSDKTGISVDKVQVVLGDTSLPAGPLSGGSWVTASVVPAIAAASNAAVHTMLGIAASTAGSSFHGRKPDDLAYTAGRIHAKDQPAMQGVPFEDLLKQANIRSAIGNGKSLAASDDPNAQKYSQHSYGAQFVEVTWDPGIARLRVSRVVSVIDVGRVINLGPARNQVQGAIVMGVGMGIFEETRYDPRNGNPINSNFADYVVSTSADAPEIDVTFLNYPDLTLNEYGARGVGEIGLAGIAPAITAAVYHATGVRVRELPVKIENLMMA